MKYITFLLALVSFDVSAAFSANVCADEEKENEISHLYTMKVLSIDKYLSSITISTPEKIQDKYELSTIYFVVSMNKTVILSANLKTELNNGNHLAILTIANNMLNNIEIYAHYSDQLGKVLFDTNYCEFELNKT